MNTDLWVCPVCGSSDVQELRIVWTDPNTGRRDDADDLATLYHQPYWCYECEEHPDELVQRSATNFPQDVPEPTTKMIPTAPFAPYCLSPIDEAVEVPIWAKYVLIDRDGTLIAAEQMPGPVAQVDTWWNRYQLGRYQLLQHTNANLEEHAVPNWYQLHWEI